jgi:hypothetical protein
VDTFFQNIFAESSARVAEFPTSRHVLLEVLKVLVILSQNGQQPLATARDVAFPLEMPPG